MKNLFLVLVCSLFFASCEYKVESPFFAFKCRSYDEDGRCYSDTMNRKCFYQKGDVVYLKPDSVIAVISETHWRHNNTSDYPYYVVKWRLPNGKFYKWRLREDAIFGEK